MKKILINILMRLRVLFPDYWTMNGKYCKEWDTLFNKLMENHTFKPHEDSKCISELGPCLIWTENQPYACCTLVINRAGPHLSIRPSRISILKGIKKLKNDMCKNEIETIQQHVKKIKF